LFTLQFLKENSCGKCDSSYIYKQKTIAPLDFMVYLSMKFSIYTSRHGSIYCTWR